MQIILGLKVKLPLQSFPKSEIINSNFTLSISALLLVRPGSTMSSRARISPQSDTWRVTTAGSEEPSMTSFILAWRTT